MIRTLLRRMRGYVRIQIRGNSPERFLNLCRHHKIALWGLEPVDGFYEMLLSVSDFKRLGPLLKKTGMKVRVKKRYGFPFFAYRYRKRKLFFLSLALGLLLIKVYSLFIWDIHFVGNEAWPDETLSLFLMEQGVSPGMLKKQVDCPAIVKAIRKEYNDIVWVSASIEGSRICIRIKENEMKEKPEKGQDQETSAVEVGTNLVASKDGVITRLVTRTGIPQVHVGDRVKKGDLLILGRIDLLNDSKEVTGQNYCKADGDVYADTTLPYQETISLVNDKKVFDGKKRYRWYVEIADFRISIGTTWNRFPKKQVTVQERSWKLGENFYLPVKTGMMLAESYSVKKEKDTKEEAQRTLSDNFSLFCRDLEEKGIQIKEKNVKITMDRRFATASGTLKLNESITKESIQEIEPGSGQEGNPEERKEQDESVGTEN